MDKRADIKVGFSCNNRCIFCAQGEKRKIYKDKTFEQIKSFINKAFNDHCTEIVFTGGEALIRKDIVELVKYAKNKGFERIQIQTNGRMLAYKTLCLKLIQAGANMFSPSIHGHCEDLHDTLTQSKGSFNDTVLGIKNLKKLGVYIFTNTVICRQNYKYLPQVAKLLTDLKVDQFQLAFVHGIGCVKRDFFNIVPKKTQVLPYVYKALNLGIKMNKVVMTEAIPFCLMKGYEKYVAESLMPSVFNVYQHEDKVENFTLTRKKLSKIKSEKCKYCKYYNVCEGPWKEYPHFYGWEEFKPVC
jgi:radical SAM protein with 4Fe4S-binding SPASM domain